MEVYNRKVAFNIIKNKKITFRHIIYKEVVCAISFSLYNLEKFKNMSKLIINGGQKLFGKINISSAKNALLPIICASILANSPVLLKNVPHYTDVNNLLAILTEMGATIKWRDSDVEIDSSTIFTTKIPTVYAQKFRASVVLLGALLSKFGSGETCLPGGCQIGARPIDIHLDGLERLGVVVKQSSNKIYCDAQKFAGGTVNLRFPSVGATQNLVMSAVLMHLKTTIIRNCAKEPEVVDLCNFINKMGGKIYGAGTDTIVVVGVKQLNGIEYCAISDRIETGTYLIASAMCGGKTKISNVNIEHNRIIITILANLGCEINWDGDNIYISSSGDLGGNLKLIQTGVYPNFPTDMQSQTLAMLCVANGTYSITENLFESRFAVAKELCKMGADVRIQNNTAIIYGKPGCLAGTNVDASDLRGGASLVLAGLVASGQTAIDKAEYIYRGYYNLEEKLSRLGANIYKEDR